MNIQPVNNQPVSDDNDLAKVLSGANGALPAAEPAGIAKPAPMPDPADLPPPEETPEPEIPAPVAEPEPAAPAISPVMPTGEHGELDEIKKQALEELRPLVDKLDVPPEEMFDILLLMIRSTDDEELVKKAHEVAVKIEDETRQAQALLDIIKEVDYFSNK